MDCQAALDKIYEYLDEELTPETQEDVRQHLAACLPCLELFGFEQAYLRFLEARSKAQKAPPHLKRKILERIIEEIRTNCD